MGTEIRRESFTAMSVSREDVNYAMRLPLDDEFGMGFSDDDMMIVAKRLGEAYAELGDWSVLRDVLDILEVNDEDTG